MADKLPPKQRFSAAYESVPPWEIYKPRQQFVDSADSINGRVLDAGCRPLVINIQPNRSQQVSQTWLVVFSHIILVAVRQTIAFHDDPSCKQNCNTGIPMSPSIEAPTVTIYHADVF
jgi:hypothetical protein